MFKSNISRFWGLKFSLKLPRPLLSALKTNQEVLSSGEVNLKVFKIVLILHFLFLLVSHICTKICCIFNQFLPLFMWYKNPLSLKRLRDTEQDRVFLPDAIGPRSHKSLRCSCPRNYICCSSRD